YFAGVLLGAAVAAGVGVSQAGVGDGQLPYKQQIETWRKQRVDRLTAPTGWLSLVGLDWLKEGPNTIGAAKDNDIVLAGAPARLGVILLREGKAAIKLAPDADATIDGTKQARAELLDDSHEKPTT